MAELNQSFDFEVLVEFAADALEVVEVPRGDARVISRHILEANLTATDSHGIIKLATYVNAISNGRINARPNIGVEREMGATAVVNGDNGMGHLVMDHAANLAIDKAQDSGFAWVGVNHSNHAGAGAVYANIVRDAGMIGIYISVSGTNFMAPWGGNEPLLGTNPIAVSVPAGDVPPINLDMATSVASFGKIQQAAKRGEAIPKGWIMDDKGTPITDSRRASEGLILPIGGPKGYGLALIFGILGGTLNGAKFGREVKKIGADHSEASNVGQLIIALSIDAFGEFDVFTSKIDEVVHSMKSSPALPGFEEVRLPGENSYKEKNIRLKTGVPIHPSLRNSLDDLAENLSIVPLGER